MTFIEDFRLLLDMATVDKTESSKYELASCTGYDKSKDKTESCKNKSVAQLMILTGPSVTIP